MIVVEKRTCVESISAAACEDGPARAEDVVDSAGENAKHCKRPVQSSVRIVGRLVVLLPTSPNPVRAFEHARAAEADQRHQNHLGEGGIVAEPFGLRNLLTGSLFFITITLLHP